jgi:hypothetical protein
MPSTILTLSAATSISQLRRSLSGNLQARRRMAPDSHLGGSAVPKIAQACARVAELCSERRQQTAMLGVQQRDAKAAEADWSAAAKERTSRRDPDVAARRKDRRSDGVEDLGCLL